MKKRTKLLLLVAVLLMLVTVSAVALVVFADDELTATVPFAYEETTAEITTAKKPAYEDLTKNFLTVNAGVKQTFNATFVNRITALFSQTYPRLAERFNYGVMYDVIYDIGELEGAAAYQMGTNDPMVMMICLIPSYFKSNPNDVHTLTHELTHALQSYKDSKYGAANSANGGSWITEGLADVSRYSYDPSFALPSFSSSQKYIDSYRVTARFFIWINENVDDTFVEQFHEGLKCEAYTSNLFVKITGKTVDELWQMYAASDHKITGRSV